MSANFVGNTLTQSEAIETYTPYDITSSRPWKTTMAFFANFGGIEKLFCVPDQSLNSKIMNQCNIDFFGIKKGAKISFHRHFKKFPWIWKQSFRGPVITTNCQFMRCFQNFYYVLAEGLGALKGVKAKTYVDQDVEPKYIEARAVPCVLRTHVEL